MEASALHAPAAIGRFPVVTLLRLRSDDQLVALFRRGNDDAFRVIHDRYRQRLFAYARQMLSGSRSDAEDALQDVFLRAYSALRADSRPVSLRAWLYRVAHNRCVDELRRPVAVGSEYVDLPRATLADPLVEAERREDLRRLVEDVRRLPAQQRSALLMRELEGLSYAELAGALDVTVPAVKSLLVRARLALVEAIDARETACWEIREDLALAQGRGVRASGLARRHMRDCPGCQDYRTGLRTARGGFGALSLGHGGAGLLAKLLSVGGGGAAAGGSAAAGGGAIAVGGGAAATAAKVAAIVCCAAVVGTGAEVVTERIAPPAKPEAHHSAPPSSAPPVALAPAQSAAHVAMPRVHGPARDRPGQAHSLSLAAAGLTAGAVEAPSVKPPASAELASGGVLAPDEDVTSQQPALDDGGVTGSGPLETGTGDVPAAHTPSAAPASATSPAGPDQETAPASAGSSQGGSSAGGGVPAPDGG